MTMPVPLLAWVRTPVVPRHGALRHHLPHTLAAPLVTHLLQQRIHGCWAMPWAPAATRPA